MAKFFLRTILLGKTVDISCECSMEIGQIIGGEHHELPSDFMENPVGDFKHWTSYTAADPVKPLESAEFWENVRLAVDIPMPSARYGIGNLGSLPKGVVLKRFDSYDDALKYLKGKYGRPGNFYRNPFGDY